MKQMAMDDCKSSSPLLKSEDEKREEGVVGLLVKELGEESRRLWKLAGPAIFTAICQYSLGALTQTFAGLVGELELAAVSVENSVIAGLAFGVMVLVPISALLFVVFFYSFFHFLCDLLSRKSHENVEKNRGRLHIIADNQKKKKNERNYMVFICSSLFYF